MITEVFFMGPLCSHRRNIPTYLHLPGPWGWQKENQRELGCTWHWSSHYFSLSSEVNINIAHRTQELELFSRAVAFNDNYLAWFLAWLFTLYNVFPTSLKCVILCLSEFIITVSPFFVYQNRKYAMLCMDYLVWSALYTNSFCKCNQDN